MILSGSVNLFDGVELLPALLRTLRPEFDHMSVVYQMHSNRGNQAAVELMPTLAQMARYGWLDDSLCYHPEHAAGPPSRHETRKRTLGLDLARRVGATHYMSLDIDEFYRPTELRQVKRQVELHGYDATACRIQNYHRRPVYRCVGLDRYLGFDLYVPLIYEIGEYRTFETNVEYFCCVDQTRRMRYARPCIFDPKIVVMHHMTTVRRSWKGLTEKFANSSTRSPFQSPTELADLVWAFKPGPGSRPLVDLVPDEFHIEASFKRHRQIASPSMSHNLGKEERK